MFSRIIEAMVIRRENFIRPSFNRHLDTLLDTFEAFESQFGELTPENKESQFLYQERIFFNQLIKERDLGDSEKVLLSQISSWFAFKHQLRDFANIPTTALNQPSQGICIEFVAPLGGGKTSIAKALAQFCGVKPANMEGYMDNIHWRRQQKYPKYFDVFTGRSQVHYLSDSLYAGFKLAQLPGVNIFDSGAHNDKMWAHTYNEPQPDGRKLFVDDEYLAYLRLIEIFRPLFRNPSLLAAIVPDSIEDLKKGVRRRVEAEPERAGELIFTEAGNNTLAFQRALVLELIEDLAKQGLEVLPLEVNPLAVFDDSDYTAGLVSQIRARLDLV